MTTGKFNSLEEASLAIAELKQTQNRQTQRIRELEQENESQKKETERLLKEAGRTLDWAKHVYRVDHCGYIWVYDVDKKDYHKTEMRVHQTEIANGSITPEKLNKRVWEALVSNLIKNTGSTAIGPDGYWYVDGVNTYVKAQGRPGRDGKDADVWTIGEDNHWYLNGEKTEFVAKGENGKDGKDGIDGVSPILRVSPDGMSLEISSDGGETWLPFVKDFNLLRVLGYLDSKAQLPKNAEVGHIYAVWNAEADNEFTGKKGAYELYINTVLDWVKDGEITKVYNYDTELPSSAADGTTVLVPVYDLTLDKGKVDGYKVYKFSAAINGWVMVLNTAEIYAAQEDIVNRGDNVYALVQGTVGITEKKIKEETFVSKQDYARITNNTGSALMLIIVDNGNRIFHSVGNGTYMLPNNCEVYLVNDHDISNVVVSGRNVTELEYMPEGIYPYYVLTRQSLGDIYITTEGNGIETGDKEGVLVETKTTTLLTFTNTYELYKRVVDWVKFGTNASIAYHLVQDINEGAADNVLSGKAVKEAVNNISKDVEDFKKETNEKIDDFKEETNTKIEDFKEEVKDTYGDYEESPEFVRVYLDKEGHILWGIQQDGNVYFGAGVPRQVKSYINQKVAEINRQIDDIIGIDDVTEKIDSLNEIIDFLETYKNSDSLQALLKAQDARMDALAETKVDKEEGKSLIDAEFAEGVSYEENPEFASVLLDNEGRIIEAVRKDGTKVLPAGVDIQGVVTTTIDSPEWAVVYLIGDRIAFGIRNDGSVDWGAGVPKPVRDYIDKKLAEYDSTEEIEKAIKDIREELEEALSKKVDGEYIDNPEFMHAVTDSEGKFMEGTKPDGTKYFPAPVEFGDSVGNDAAKVYTTSSQEWIKVFVDAQGKVIAGIRIDGSVYIGKLDGIDKALSENIKTLEALIKETEDSIDEKVKVFSDVFSIIDDVEERMEVVLDAEGRIVSWRGKDGVLHENTEIETPILTAQQINLSSTGLTAFEKALKNNGFNPGGAGDFSDEEVIEIPEPKRYGLINLIVDALPVGDTEIRKGYVEYYDYSGNYFKIETDIATQGQSSRRFVKNGGKGNFTLDLEKDVKFGYWVEQDSFHLKGCAKDVTCGFLSTSYKWAYMIMEYLDAKPNRVLLSGKEITETDSTGDFATDWLDDARCLPDGFPVEIYVNGAYYGLGALQLKKHRKNYSMKKSDFESFFLDFEYGGDSFWKGDIPWNAMDIKNPKTLYCMDGSEFDGDNPKELIDSTSDKYDPSDKNHKGSATTKEIIKTFPVRYNEVKQLVDNGSIEEAKVKFNETFDYNSCMLVYIMNCLMNNADSVIKNTLWGTYKNGKIAPMLWDLDGVYGEPWTGLYCSAPSSYMWDNTYAKADWPLGCFWTLYKDEIKDAYARLRRDGIISIDTWREVVYGWVNRIGQAAYDRNLEKWDETPSYRKNYTNTEYWTQGKSMQNSGVTPQWNENTQYKTGDKAAIQTHQNVPYDIVYTAVKDSVGICPVTKFYKNFPIVGGYYNSPKRMEKWMKKQIELCDAKLEYNE